MFNLKQRTDIIEIFSTFLNVKDDHGHLTQWLYDRKLKQNMETEESIKPDLSECESIWVQYWYKLADQNLNFNGIKHLQSYLQEPCFFSAKKVYLKLPFLCSNWRDTFQEAVNFTIKNTLKIFQKYNWQLSQIHKKNLKFWCEQKIEDFLKELYLQRKQIEGASDWRILRDKNTTLKMWEKILLSSGIEANKLSTYLLALECFRNHYQPLIRKNQRLPDPTGEQWQKIVIDYNSLRKHRQIIDKIDLETIKKLLDQCVEVIRNFYKMPTYISLDGELELNNFEPESSDNLISDKLEKEEEWQQINQILSQDFLSLASEKQTFLILAYGLELGQTEIAKLFSLKQYQVSRKLNEYRQILLSELVNLKEKQLSRKLLKDEMNYLAKQINDWLKDCFCKQEFFDFLEKILLQDLKTQILVISAYYNELYPLKNVDQQKSLLIKHTIAQKLNVSFTDVEKSLQFTHNYLLQKLKVYLKNKSFGSRRLNFELIPTLDQTLLEFIYLFLKNVSYAQLFVKINNPEL